MSNSLPYIPINFDPNEHRYYDDSGREYISVTTLIKQFLPFDQEEIAGKVINYPGSKYYGMTKQEVLERWKKSAPAGTSVHDGVEQFLKEGTIIDDPDVAPLVKKFSKVRFRGKVYSECILHDEDYLIAGMADIIEELPHLLWLYDIKTSVARPKGDKLSEDHLHKFSIQLEIYRRMIEKRFKKKCKIGGIFWFKQFFDKRAHTEIKFVRVNNVEEFVNNMYHVRKLEIFENGLL